jgi:hypothetical protein
LRGEGGVVSTETILITGVGVLLALPLVWRAYVRRLDPFEPMVIFALAWGVMFVLRPAAILIRSDYIFYSVDISSALGKAELLALLGAVAFVVGYELSFGRRLANRLPAPPSGIAPESAMAAALVVSAVGVAALALVLLPNGGLHAVDTFLNGRSLELNDLIEKSTIYLWYGSLLVVPAALAGFAVAFVDRRPALVAGAVLLMSLALLRIVPTGNRIFLLVLLGAIAVFVFLQLGRRPGVVALAIALVLALVASYIVLTIRDPDNRAGFTKTLRGLVTTPSRVLTPLAKGPDAEMAPALAGALLVVPDQLHHRYGGATIGDLLLRPIPRQLWAGKPDTPGHEVTAKVWPVARTTGDFDPAFTPLLFFYWDFGLPGVFVGMALLGIAARALYEYLRRRSGSVLARLVFAAGLWYLVIALRFDPVSVFVWGVIVFVPLVLVLRWRAPRAEIQSLETTGPPVGTPPTKTVTSAGRRGT